MRDMTFDDFMRVMLTAWPNAIVEEAVDGELVVHTGVRERNGVIEEMELDEPF